MSRQKVARFESINTEIYNRISSSHARDRVILSGRLLALQVTVAVTMAIISSITMRLETIAAIGTRIVARFTPFPSSPPPTAHRPPPTDVYRAAVKAHSSINVHGDFVFTINIQVSSSKYRRLRSFALTSRLYQFPYFLSLSLSLSLSLLCVAQ